MGKQLVCGVTVVYALGPSCMKECSLWNPSPWLKRIKSRGIISCEAWASSLSWRFHYVDYSIVLESMLVRVSMNFDLVLFFGRTKKTDFQWATSSYMFHPLGSGVCDVSPEIDRLWFLLFYDWRIFGLIGCRFGSRLLCILCIWSRRDIFRRFQTTAFDVDVSSARIAPDTSSEVLGTNWAYGLLGHVKGHVQTVDSDLSHYEETGKITDTAD